MSNHQIRQDCRRTGSDIKFTATSPLYIAEKFTEGIFDRNVNFREILLSHFSHILRLVRVAEMHDDASERLMAISFNLGCAVQRDDPQARRAVAL